MEQPKDIDAQNYFEKVINHGEMNFFEKHTVPSQLTSKLGKSTIVGREKELKEIGEQLNSSNTLLLINGIGGVGKSTIASYYLDSQKDNYAYYGFFEGLESFTVELKEPLNLKAEKPNELLIEALSKLRKLEGKKLLVLDDVKESEANQEIIDKILGLKNSGYKILITSREEIANVASYNLDVLSKDDAKALFNSIYKIEDEPLLEEILEYLGYHAFFIEKTALSIKKTLTPQMIVDKFKSGEFAKISVKRKENFNKFLGQLFTLDGLDEEEILMLKQLSALPSIEIGFEFLENIFKKTQKKKTKFNWNFFKFFQKKEEQIYNHPNLEELLDFLSEKGWSTKLDGGYKLHQIIKEYLLANHTPSFEEIEIVVDSLKDLIDNSADAQVAVDNRENIVYFESLVTLLDRLEIENEKVGSFFNDFGLICQHLGFYQKAEPFYLKALKIREKVLGEEHSNTATSYNNLAELYRNKGEYQKAAPLYLKALKILKKLLGEEHPYTVTIYNNLALFYDSIGEDQKVESLYLKALKVRERVLGEEHPDTAISYNNLGGFYYGQGDYERAYEFMKRAVEVRSKVLPSNHPNLIDSKEGLEMIEGRL